MALSAYDKQILNEADQQKVLAAQKAWIVANAKGDAAGKASAAALAEATRKAYGYSGGSDGSQYVALEGYEGAEKVQSAAADMDKTYNGINDDLDKAYDGVNDAYKAQADASKAEIEKQKQAALKQAYISNMIDQKNIDQQLRANGISGGLTESSRVALQNNYRTNRNTTNAAAIEAEKDVDLSTQQSIAANELNRANARASNETNRMNAKYSADMTAAQFQNTAATNARNIEQTRIANDQAAISTYVNLLQNGYVTENNADKVASALGMTREEVLSAANDVRVSNNEGMVFALLDAGVYDDSFVSMLGNKWSAETLKAVADKAATTAAASSSGKDSSGSSGEGSEKVYTLEGLAKINNYGEGWTDATYEEFAQMYGYNVEDVKAAFADAKKSDTQVTVADPVAVAVGSGKNTYVVGQNIQTSVGTFSYDELSEMASSYDGLSKKEKVKAADMVGLTETQLKNLMTGIRKNSAGSTIYF